MDIKERYYMACHEFLRGCSCASHDRQEECAEYLKAFCDRLRRLAKLETISIAYGGTSHLHGCSPPGNRAGVIRKINFMYD